MIIKNHFILNLILHSKVQIFTSLSDNWFDLWILKNILRLMHVSAFGETSLSPWLLHTNNLSPPNECDPVNDKPVNYQHPIPSGLLRLLTVIPCFPSITTVITLVCACVAWSVLCLWLMHLEQLLRVLVCQGTSLTAYVGLHVCCMWWLVLGLQMQVHRTEVDLFSGPHVKGVSAPSRTRYLVNLQRAERLRGWVQNGGRLLAGDSDAFMQVISPNHLDCESNPWR